MERKEKVRTATRIYVASLADYNSGVLHGRWIDAHLGVEHLQNEIQAMLAESGEAIAEDWAIHDYEGFGSLRLDEFTDSGTVAELAELIETHGTVFAELVGYLGGICSLDEAKRYMEEGYCGSFGSVESYVEEFIEDCYGDILQTLPVFLRYHIDYEAIARDFEIGGDIFALTVDGEVHVFNASI